AAALLLWRFSHTLRAHGSPMCRAVHTVAVVGPLVIAASTVVEVMPSSDWQADNASPFSDSHARAPLPLRPRHVFVALGTMNVRRGTAEAGRDAYIYAGTSVRHCGRHRTYCHTLSPVDGGVHPDQAARCD